MLEQEAGFCHPDIPDVRITARVWWHRDRGEDPYRFEPTHYAHTPEQVRPYVPSSPFARTNALAVERGIAAIMDQIERAKRAGHAPDASLLLRWPLGA